MLTTKGKYNEARLAGNTAKEKQISGVSWGFYVHWCVCACVWHAHTQTVTPYFPWRDGE